MKSPLVLAGLAGLSILTAGCATTRGDVRNARQDVREANRYGDRYDQREARRELRKTRRDYQRDNRCGPGYGRPC
jgi:predicted small secreted protein